MTRVVGIKMDTDTDWLRWYNEATQVPNTLLLYGGRDTLVTDEYVERYARAVRPPNAAAVVRFPRTPHAGQGGPAAVRRRA